MTKMIFRAFALDLPSESDGAPRVTARGEYDLAQQIVACAKKYGVPVVERPALANSLVDVPVDEELPVDLFEAAAALLAEVGRLR